MFDFKKDYINRLRNKIDEAIAEDMRRFRNKMWHEELWKNDEYWRSKTDRQLTIIDHGKQQARPINTNASFITDAEIAA